MNPGDLLSYVVRETTGQAAQSCGPCRDCITEMNQNGWWWCWKNRGKISQRLIMAANQHGYHLTHDNALGLVTTAFGEFYKYRKTKGSKNMNTYTIRKTMTVKDPKSPKDVLGRLGEAQIIGVSVTVQTDGPAQFPITETMMIEAESFEKALSEMDQAESLSIQVGTGAAPRPLPPPSKPKS